MVNMVVKTYGESNDYSDLEDILKSVKEYNLGLNPFKWSFWDHEGKFMGFLLTRRGIEANPDKLHATIDMRNPTTVMEVHKLTGHMAALSRFFYYAWDKDFNFSATLRKKEGFEWKE